jgi:ComF family protein
MLPIEKLTALIAPHYCLVCRTSGELLCAWCLPEVLTPPPSRCYRCHRATAESAVCPKCRRHAPLGHVWVACEYGGASKQLLHKFKFERAKAAVFPVAMAVESVLPYLNEQMLVSYIPAATSRVRIRGYDQSALVSRRLARSLNRRHGGLLERYGQSRQVGARREQRLAQLEGAFLARHPETVKNARILLVDDVVTTGATLATAARALSLAGAKSVDAAVFAQAQ